MVIRPMLAKEISENPRCSGNREGFGGFTPIRTIVEIGKNQRHPHQEPKDHEHDGQKTSREKRQSIRKKSNRRECERAVVVTAQNI